MKLVKASDKTVAEVARALGINDTTLGNWVKADRAEHGVPDATGLLPLTAAEQAELTRLRREVSKLVQQPIRAHQIDALSASLSGQLSTSCSSSTGRTGFIPVLPRR